ncbi:MAG: YncE family protein [Alphaproteobacteria bacterium]|nr:YncE family protein [Alphaproteobacteria bacterium]MBV8407218.1 YncE family protein [Alphaproteobacteria bacterium]
MTDPLRLAGYVDLPAHEGNGGFDHAAVHAATGHVYAAHTANDAVDVFDPVLAKHLFSIPGLAAVAGALVSEESQLVFTSNRGENTIGVFAPGPRPEVLKIPVGVRPNGLAYDPVRKLVLAANVGDPAIAGSCTLSIVSLDRRAMIADLGVAGRTRWTVYDPDGQRFYVNIADPAEIVVVDADKPTAIAAAFKVPAAGPHGLDIDLEAQRLFCACDAGRLITLESPSGKVLRDLELSGTPDVVFFNAVRRQLYVAIGNPGVIDVFDTARMTRLGRVETERGAHTIAFAPSGDRVYAFLPQTHRAAIFEVLH